MNPTPDTRPTPAHPISSVLATLLSAALRLVRYGLRPPNVAPPAALGRYGVARAPLRQRLLMALGARAIRDVALKLRMKFPRFSAWVCRGMVVYVVLGRLLLKKTTWGW